MRLAWYGKNIGNIGIFTALVLRVVGYNARNPPQSVHQDLLQVAQAFYATSTAVNHPQPGRQSIHLLKLFNVHRHLHR